MGDSPTYKGLKWDAHRQKLMVMQDGTSLFDVDQALASKPTAGYSAITNTFMDGSDLIIVYDD